MLTTDGIAFCAESWKLICGGAWRSGAAGPAVGSVAAAGVCWEAGGGFADVPGGVDSEQLAQRSNAAMMPSLAAKPRIAVSG
jgi:hypothetical protein